MPVLWRAAFFSVVAATAGCRTVPAKFDPADFVIARQWMLRGLEARRAGDLVAAETYLNQALQLAPFDERLYMHLGRTYWEQGRHEEAVRCLDEAIRLSAEPGELLVEQGRMYYALGQLDEAERVARRAVPFASVRAAAHELIGHILRQRGRWEEALEHFHRSLDEEPRNAAVQLAIADIYRLWGEPRRMLSTLYLLDRSALSHQQQAWTDYLEATAYKQLGRVEEALGALRRATAAASAPVDWLAELAEWEWEAGDFVDAEYHLRTALARDPTHKHARQLATRIAPTLLADNQIGYDSPR